MPGSRQPLDTRPVCELAYRRTPVVNVAPPNLPGSAPDALEEAVLLGQPVQAVVALAHGADEAAHGVGLVLACVGY